MGTRGCIRIIVGNKMICIYNHWDLYPSGLGFDLLRELIDLLNKYSIDGLIDMFTKIKIVDNTTKPSEEDIKALEKYTDLTVSRQSKDDWYCLLRKCQGPIIETLECGYANNMKCDEDGDLFIEYVYMIDLNNKKLKCKQADWDVDLCVASLENFLNKQK